MVYQTKCFLVDDLIIDREREKDIPKRYDLDISDTNTWYVDRYLINKEERMLQTLSRNVIPQRLNETTVDRLLSI